MHDHLGCQRRGKRGVEEGEKGCNWRAEREQGGARKRQKPTKMKTVEQVGSGNWMQMDGELFGCG